MRHDHLVPQLPQQSTHPGRMRSRLHGLASLCSKTISPASFKTQYALERSPRSKPMMSCPSKMFFPLACIVLIFCIAGLLSLCFEHVHHWELNASRGRPAFSHLVCRVTGSY